MTHEQEMKRLKFELEGYFDVDKYGHSICWNDVLYRATYDNSGNCNRCVFQDIDNTHDCTACKANPDLTYVWIIDRSH